MGTGNGTLNILQINTLDGIGGAARIARQLKDRLAGRGHTSRMLVGNKMTGDQDVEQLPHASKHNRFVRSGINFIADRWQLQYLNIPNSFSIKKRADVAGADVVNVHNLHGAYFNPLALKGLAGVTPLVYTLHDMWPLTGHCAHSFGCPRWRTGCGHCPDLAIYPALERDSTALNWKLKRWIYERSTFTVVTPSRWLRDKVDQSMLSGKDAHVICNGVDETVFRPMDRTAARKKRSLPEEKTIILFSSHGGIGSCWRSEEHLFAALNTIDARDLMFINVGSEENLDGKFRRDMEWLSVPHVAEPAAMAEYCAAADLFLYPTRADNCPLVVLESLACGTPVVTFNTGGVPELVGHLETGYIAAYDDAADLAHGLELFVNDEARRRNAGDAARKTVEERFTLDGMVRSYIDLYYRILEDGARSNSRPSRNE